VSVIFSHLSPLIFVEHFRGMFLPPVDEKINEELFGS
jgi:hypothetical protein